ncbi:TetR family transcriptional regulator [Pseudonocardia hierapolitana]|uniref:TetR family transcriptional regulator n=1 Tax=Pseudonocardia hierapolitana TaxID=1128676 RepID=A0A561SMV0_9PSEU|nr:TetR family transcriptional regulator [Pseudonocardia hierapolitana]TWF76193.1 TetR family transcriptional regulator [Pseudonocardia hierapolitana]
MARWAPGASDRLQRAAMELFAEHGYEATTVAGIAERAGVTERTFFRYFADKREVLFPGEEQLEAVFVDAIAGAPADASLTGLLIAALDAGGGALQDLRGREFARTRNAIIAANAQLQERELLKLAKLSRAVTAALVARGVADVPARLAGDLVVSVFGTAFARWIAPGETRDLVELQRDGLAVLSDLARADSG